MRPAAVACDVEQGEGEGGGKGVGVPEGPDPLGVHSVIKEGHGGLGEDIFVQVHRQVVLAEAGEDLPKVLLVLLDSPAAHQNNVDVDKQERQITELFMHYTLKSTPTVP